MKRAIKPILVLCVLAISVCLGGAKQYAVGSRSFAPASGSAPTTVFTDLFPYAGGDIVAVSGGNWTYGVSGSLFIVTSNTVASNTSNPSVRNSVVWSGSGSGTATPNQFTALTFHLIGGDELGPEVRATGDTLYEGDCYSGGCRIVKSVSGTTSNLTSFSGTISSGDVIELDVTGTTSTVLVLKQNGTPMAGQTYTDSSSPITSGTWGIFGFGTSATTTASVATGGNL